MAKYFLLNPAGSREDAPVLNVVLRPGVSEAQKLSQSWSL
jgi:hypothetical protein